MSAEKPKTEDKVERATTIVLVDVAGTATSISFVKVGFLKIFIIYIDIYTRFIKYMSIRLVIYYYFHSLFINYTVVEQQLFSINKLLIFFSPRVFKMLLIYFFVTYIFVCT